MNSEITTSMPRPGRQVFEPARPALASPPLFPSAPGPRTCDPAVSLQGSAIPPSLRLTAGRLLVCLSLCLTPAGAVAQTSRPAVLRDVGIDQKLNTQVPLDLEFRDESGRKVRLSEYFDDKPVILTLVYYRCPMLCTLSLNGLVKTMRPLGFTAGKEFTILTISFDPREGPELAAEKKANYLKSYDRPEAAQGWYFLVGDEESIRRLAETVGFRYAYDEATDQFAHASGLILLTPRGRISKYFYGIEYSSNDLRLGLTEASQNKIGSLAEQILLFCYHYDPTTGKYGLAITNIIRLLGLMTLLALGWFVFRSLRRDWRKRRRLKTQEVPT